MHHDSMAYGKLLDLSACSWSPCLIDSTVVRIFSHLMVCSSVQLKTTAPSLLEMFRRKGFLVLPLSHATLSTVTHTVAWGVAFRRPRSKRLQLKAPPLRVLPRIPQPRQGRDSFGEVKRCNRTVLYMKLQCALRFSSPSAY